MSYPTSIYCHTFSPTGGSINVKQLAVEAPVGTTIDFYQSSNDSNPTHIVIGENETYEITNFSMHHAVVGPTASTKALFTYEKGED